MSNALAHSQDPVSNTADALTTLTQTASAMGADIVDVAGVFDSINTKAHGQLAQLERVNHIVRTVVEGNTKVSDTIEQVSSSSSAVLEQVEDSVRDIRSASQNSRSIAEWVGALEGRLAQVEETLSAVKTSNGQIASIARQINILAVNAKIEAARAGDLGRGFGVVAEAINDLSGKTGAAAQTITERVEDLGGLVDVLLGESKTVGHDANAVIDGSKHADAALSEIADRARENDTGAKAIAQEAKSTRTALDSFAPEFTAMSQALRETASEIETTRGRVNGLIDQSETILQGSVSLGGTSDDQPFIDTVCDLAGRISSTFEEAVGAGRISLQDLFDRTYEPIPGTDPQQVLARFTKFTDAVLPSIIEPALEIDRRIVFCAAVDVNGYLPTHNKKFSAPQGDDPVWNSANSRNRRIFDDRVGLKSGRNTQPFLLQTYRRDMGGGAFVLMKDVSAPITVQGRHWGGLRLAYKMS